MGRRKGFLLALAMSTICWVAVPAAAHAADLTGTWIVTDGPHAGTPLTVGYKPNTPSGFVSKQDNKATEARGYIRDPNDHCPYYHFEGRINGKKIQETDCVRVSSTGYSQPFLIEMAEAIKHEEKDKPGAAGKDLQLALDEAEKALKAGTLNQQTFDEIEFGIKHAHKLDKSAAKELKEIGSDKEAEKALDKGVNIKEQVVGIAPPELKLLQPPKLKPIDAFFVQASFSTTYTENATDPDGRPLSYTWALSELNDPTCIRFDDNSPAANQAVWHHADSDGCNHALQGSNGHQGVIGVVVTDEKFSCGAAYSGSDTGTGGPPSACRQLSVK